jgi:distribution and morphology protein 12
MSVDIDWQAATSGPDGLALAETIREFIHERFQQTTLPRFIKSVSVHSFEFGSSCPDVEIKDICDPLPDFYEDILDEDEEDDELSGPDEGDASGRSYSNHTVKYPVQDRHTRGLKDFHSQSPHASPSRSNRRDRDRPSLAPLPQTSLKTSMPSIFSPPLPGGTSTLHHIHAFSSGLSGAQTPLAAAAGAHLPAGWPDSSYISRPKHHRHSESNSSLTPSSASLSPAKSPSAETSTLADDGNDEAAAQELAEHLQRQKLRAARSEDVQIVWRVRYTGDVRLSLTAELLLDYPMPAFLSLPVHLNIVGASFDGVAVSAYIRKRAFFCFLAPDDADVLLGNEGSSLDQEADFQGNVNAADDAPRTKLGGLLQQIKVESEIGHTEEGKQGLKNVGKVERFVLEQIRTFFEDDLVYPSFWTFLL